ncbi:MAG: hypothetical protein U1F57_08455 [bacterium]
MERSSPIKFLFTALVLAFIVLFFWKTPFITQDGYNHQRAASILSRLSESPSESALYGENLNLHQTNELFYALYPFVKNHLSVDQYEKAFLVLSMILLVLGYQAFLKTWAPENASLWFFALPLVFHLLFARGMYNFLISVPLSLFALSLLKVEKIPIYGRIPLYGVLVWIGFLAHPFSVIVLSLVGGVALIEGVLQKESKRCGNWAFFLIPALFLALGFLLPFFQPSSQPGPSYVFDPWPSLLYKFFVFNFPIYQKWNVLLFLPYLLWAIVAMARSLRHKQPLDRRLWVLFLLGYLFFPKSGGEGNHLNERFLIYVFLFLPLGLHLNAAQKWRLGFLTGFTFLALAAYVHQGMALAQQKGEETRAVLEPLPPNQRLYPVNFDPNGPALNFKNTLHFWAMNPEKTVFSPYLFAFDRMTPLYRKKGVSALFPATSDDFPYRLVKGELCGKKDPVETIRCAEIREEGFKRILENASHYDYWLLESPPPDFVGMIQSGLSASLVAQKGTTSLWKARSH